MIQTGKIRGRFPYANKNITFPNYTPGLYDSKNTNRYDRLASANCRNILNTPQNKKE